MRETAPLPNPWQADEVGYSAHLAEQRRLYAWCLEHYGSLAPDAAREAALAFFNHEPASDPYRGLVFHDDAWHWAMLHLFGEAYWVKNPQFLKPSTEYEAQCARSVGG